MPPGSAANRSSRLPILKLEDHSQLFCYAANGKVASLGSSSRFPDIVGVLVETLAFGVGNTSQPLSFSDPACAARSRPGPALSPATAPSDSLSRVARRPRPPGAMPVGVKAKVGLAARISARIFPSSSLEAAAGQAWLRVWVHPQNKYQALPSRRPEAIPAVWIAAGVKHHVAGVVGLVGLAVTRSELSVGAQGKPDSAFCAVQPGSLLSALKALAGVGASRATMPATSTRGGRDCCRRSGLRPSMASCSRAAIASFSLPAVSRSRPPHGDQVGDVGHGFALAGFW